MNKKITWIIGLQALIIITLFWVLVFYGKDEFEAYQGEHEEEIESPNLVSEKDGISVVELTPETQTNSGISTSKIQSMSHQGSIKTFGSVLPIDKLIEAKTQYVALTTELNIAKSSSPQLQAQLQRLKTLNEDDKNVSDSVVQEAQSQLNASQSQKSQATSVSAGHCKVFDETHVGRGTSKVGHGWASRPRFKSLANQAKCIGASKSPRYRQHANFR